MAEEDLKNLPPEERLAKLKEMEEERKKELKETEKLIKDSVAELQEKQEKKRKIPIEQVKALNLESLQTEEEKQVFRTQRFVTEKPKQAEEDTEEKPETAEKPGGIEVPGVAGKSKTEIPWPKSPDEISLEETVGKEEIAEDVAKAHQTQYKIPGKEEALNLYMLAQEAAQDNTVDRIRDLEGRPYHDWSTNEREFARRMNYISDTNKEKLKDQYHGRIADDMLDKVDVVKDEMERLKGDYIK